jgi:hypothetical protein
MRTRLEVCKLASYQIYHVHGRKAKIFVQTSFGWNNLESERTPEKRDEAHKKGKNSGLKTDESEKGLSLHDSATPAGPTVT